MCKISLALTTIDAALEPAAPGSRGPPAAEQKGWCFGISRSSSFLEANPDGTHLRPVMSCKACQENLPPCPALSVTTTNGAEVRCSCRRNLVLTSRYSGLLSRSSVIMRHTSETARSTTLPEEGLLSSFGKSECTGERSSSQVASVSVVSIQAQIDDKDCLVIGAAGEMWEPLEIARVLQVM